MRDVTSVDGLGEAVSGRLLTAEEVAELLSVPVTWVRAETRAGRLPHLTLGRYRRYSRDAIVAWLETQRAGRWRKHKPSVPPVEVEKSEAW
jgi:excisionase family DNA binding protein